MNSELYFLIIGSQRPTNNPGTDAYISDVHLYEKMVNKAKSVWGYKINKPSGHPDSILKVKRPLNDPALNDIFSLLKDAGWCPYFGAGMPQNLLDTHFQVRIIRNYDESEFDEAEFLYINGWGEECLAGFAGRDGDRWIGKSKTVQDIDLGQVDGQWNYFVSTSLRERLERSKLIGIHFHQLQWDNPLETREYWEIDSKYTMPPCLLPVIRQVSAEMLDGSKQYSSTYDEGCYGLIELAFRQSEIERMGDFDLAWTRENLEWTKPNAGKHMLVVSQRFRQKLIEIGVEGISYGIVRVLEEQEAEKFSQRMTYLRANPTVPPFEM